jgi:hypothetical protein
MKLTLAAKTLDLSTAPLAPLASAKAVPHMLQYSRYN